MDQGQIICFDYRGKKYNVHRVYWDKIVELAYYDALPLAQVEHNPDFLAQLIRDYSPTSFSHYQKTAERYKRVVGVETPQPQSFFTPAPPHSSTSTSRIEQLIPKPAFDFSTSVLELSHWYNCRLKPAVSKILTTLNLTIDDLEGFEQHRALEESILQAKFQEQRPKHTVSDPVASATPVKYPSTKPTEVVNAGKGDNNKVVHPEYTHIMQFLESNNFDFSLLSPVLNTLIKSPRHQYLKFTHQCENDIIVAIQNCLPSRENDRSLVFQELKNFQPGQAVPSTDPAVTNSQAQDPNSPETNVLHSIHSLGWFMDKLSECMDVIEWNYPLPNSYYYEIDSGLLAHPKLGVSMTSPEKETLLDTFRFHHDLLIKELELNVHLESLRSGNQNPTNNNGTNSTNNTQNGNTAASSTESSQDTSNDNGYDQYYKKLFYVFDRFDGLTQTESRHKIRKVIWNFEFNRETRNELHKWIVDELAEKDRQIRIERKKNEELEKVKKEQEEQLKRQLLQQKEEALKASRLQRIQNEQRAPPPYKIDTNQPYQQPPAQRTSSASSNTSARDSNSHMPSISPSPVSSTMSPRSGVSPAISRIASPELATEQQSPSPISPLSPTGSRGFSELTSTISNGSSNSTNTYPVYQSFPRKSPANPPRPTSAASTGSSTIREQLLSDGKISKAGERNDDYNPYSQAQAQAQAQPRPPSRQERPQSFVIPRKSVQTTPQGHAHHNSIHHSHPAQEESRSNGFEPQQQQPFNPVYPSTSPYSDKDATKTVKKRRSTGRPRNTTTQRKASISASSEQTSTKPKPTSGSEQTENVGNSRKVQEADPSSSKSKRSRVKIPPIFLGDANDADDSNLPNGDGKKASTGEKGIPAPNRHTSKSTSTHSEKFDRTERRRSRRHEGSAESEVHDTHNKGNLSKNSQSHLDGTSKGPKKRSSLSKRKKTHNNNEENGDTEEPSSSLRDDQFNQEGHYSPRDSRDIYDQMNGPYMHPQATHSIYPHYPAHFQKMAPYTATVANHLYSVPPSYPASPHSATHRRPEIPYGYGSPNPNGVTAARVGIGVEPYNPYQPHHQPMVIGPNGQPIPQFSHLVPGYPSYGPYIVHAPYPSQQIKHFQQGFGPQPQLNMGENDGQKGEYKYDQEKKVQGEEEYGSDESCSTSDEYESLRRTGETEEDGKYDDVQEDGQFSDVDGEDEADESVEYEEEEEEVVSDNLNQYSSQYSDLSEQKGKTMKNDSTSQEDDLVQFPQHQSSQKSFNQDNEWEEDLSPGNNENDESAHIRDEYLLSLTNNRKGKRKNSHHHHDNVSSLYKLPMPSGTPLSRQRVRADSASSFSSNTSAGSSKVHRRKVGKKRTSAIHNPPRLKQKQNEKHSKSEIVPIPPAGSDLNSNSLFTPEAYKSIDEIVAGNYSASMTASHSNPFPTSSNQPSLPKQHYPPTGTKGLENATKKSTSSFSSNSTSASNSGSSQSPYNLKGLTSGSANRKHGHERHRKFMPDSPQSI